jgi:hypothetical protein
MLLLCGGPRRIYERDLWSLHRALEEVDAETANTTSLPQLRFAPCPKVGRAADGVDAALYDLASVGTLTVVGADADVGWQVDSEKLRRYLRPLVRLQPHVVASLTAAASHWAASSSMAAKRWESAGTSPRVNVRSSSPNRRQGPVAVTR